MKYLFALLFTALSLSARAEAPRQFELVYSFFFNGQYVGNVIDSFKREGTRYELKSEARPDRTLAMLLPMLTLTSEGEIKSQRFVPSRYLQVRSNAPDKFALAEFDWWRGTLTQQYKGRTHQMPLPEGALDSLTQLYIVTLAGKLPDSMEFPVSNGRKLIHYRYEKLPGGRIDTPLGSFETVEFRRIAGPDENAISVWIAPGLHYLPLRIRVREDAGVFEQQLVKLNFRET